MDPISLITIAAVSGSSVIGKKLVEKGTEHLWDRFITRLRNKAQGNDEAEKALVTADNPLAVHRAVQAVNAATDVELVQMARELHDALPKQQVVQVAKMIQNFQHVDTLNQTFNL